LGTAEITNQDFVHLPLSLEAHAEARSNLEPLQDDIDTSFDLFRDPPISLGLFLWKISENIIIGFFSPSEQAPQFYHFARLFYFLIYGSNKLQPLHQLMHTIIY
jgi:hypothetical protein